ncbi:hypothetical protein [Solirubrum puertoriconensis]|uniref:Uncharacterized protein n=1 Tax=Solirubrum puertoriconensis TaxID=1751427 RepID=A0A9X0HN73_SOLP1|nr:hypothetical protein [Solirubrum puertoriconensis]KUG09074.1 hypothetical protein ASU33_19830 [Solirubrum puertoriconensis]
MVTTTQVKLELEQELRLRSRGSMPMPVLDALLDQLHPAVEAVAGYGPRGLKPAAAPWPEPALAFEATWPDTRTLTVALRQCPRQGSQAQVTLYQSGKLAMALGCQPEQLASTVTLCLSRQ